jgi:hypothetical protein
MIRRNLALVALVSAVALSACSSGTDRPPSLSSGEVVAQRSVDTSAITQAADVAFPIHAVLSARDLSPTLRNGVCTAAPIQARAVDAHGRTIDPTLVEFASTDSSLLSVDSVGVVRIVSCDFMNKTAGIVATVRQIHFNPEAPGRPSRARRSVAGVRS